MHREVNCVVCYGILPWGRKSRSLLRNKERYIGIVEARKQTSSSYKAFPFDRRENLSGKVAPKATDEVSAAAVAV